MTSNPREHSLLGALPQNLSTHPPASANYREKGGCNLGFAGSLSRTICCAGQADPARYCHGVSSQTLKFHRAANSPSFPHLHPLPQNKKKHLATRALCVLERTTMLLPL